MIGYGEEKKLESTGARSEVFRLGTVAAISSGIRARVRFDGESVASGKYYKAHKQMSLAVGDRVLCAHVDGSYIIIAEI